MLGRRSSAAPLERPEHHAGRVGLRRVDWVRLLIDAEHGRVRAEAWGVGYRLPRTCPISLSLAEDLIASGIPCVTRHLDTGE